MAPRKRKAAEAPKEKAAAVAAAAPPPPPSPRRTRSSSAARAASPVQQQQPQRPSKKSKPSKGEEKKKTPKESPKTDMAGDVSSKTIIVEACKQCTQFKRRALLVKEGLENGVPGVIVKVNPEKPRRGCFEVREENGRTFVSLLDMPRPFKKMRELDMDKVIADIIKNIT